MEGIDEGRGVRRGCMLTDGVKGMIVSRSWKKGVKVKCQRDACKRWRQGLETRDASMSWKHETDARDACMRF